MFGSSVKYLLFLVWVGAVYFIGIGIFTSGFLLRRQVLSNCIQEQAATLCRSGSSKPDGTGRCSKPEPTAGSFSKGCHSSHRCHRVFLIR